MRTDNRPFWDDALNVILSQVPPAGLDFPASGTRASATDIPNVALEWMVTPAYPNGAWFGHLGTHANQASLDAVPTIYLAAGSTAMVAGVSKTFQGPGVGWVEQVDGVKCFETVDERNLAYPTAPKTGTEVGIRRLCGNGYFYQRYNGARWETNCGDSVVRDAGVGSAGYDLTATGTVHVPLVSYTIPANLIGDGEEWEIDQHIMSLDVHASGSDSPSAQINGQNMRGSIPTLTAINQTARMRGSFVRLASTLAARNGAATSDLYSGGTNSDLSIDFATEKTLNIGFTPGAATNKMRLRHVCLRRIG